MNNLRRLIPIMLVNNNRLVKTVRFNKENYLGDPLNTIKIFNDKEVDEIIVLDITASSNGREPDYDLIRQLASECFMPVCYGGGIKSVDQAKRIFELGIEKVSLNSLAFNNYRAVSEIAERYGRQSVVISIDYKKDLWGRYCVYINRGKNKYSNDIFKVIKAMEDIGAGELLLNNIEKDGTYEGYDLELVKKVVDTTEIPIIACGGASNLDNVKELFNNTGVSAAAAGSIFVFSGKGKGVLLSYPSRAELKTIIQN